MAPPPILLPTWRYASYMGSTRRAATVQLLASRRSSHLVRRRDCRYYNQGIEQEALQMPREALNSMNLAQAITERYLGESGVRN